ncbi:hypothetical protein CEXT_227331 [Caerostris extrusa]|uniref:Uncharacterized protein n=1 Tax=Caerostris extrusa TaxID=172846 RepID=A0AAV4XJ41_CAEEX|nr:hypothetical protein CEXT_227331 [Caerostris extrusa]
MAHPQKLEQLDSFLLDNGVRSERTLSAILFIMDSNSRSWSPEQAKQIPSGQTEGCITVGEDGFDVVYLMMWEIWTKRNRAVWLRSKDGPRLPGCFDGDLRRTSKEKSRCEESELGNQGLYGFRRVRNYCAVRRQLAFEEKKSHPLWSDCDLPPKQCQRLSSGRAEIGCRSSANEHGWLAEIGIQKQPRTECSGFFPAATMHPGFGFE